MPIAHASPYHPQTLQDRDIAERSRQIARQSIEILNRQPRPDTFLGRKTQEPFPEEKKA